MAATWGALFRAFLPVLMLKEIVGKMFQLCPQDSETVEGGSIDDFRDSASDHSVHESPETGEIEGHPGSTHNIQQEEKSELHLHPGGEAQEGGHDDSSKEMVVMMFPQQRHDPEMVEENGVDDQDRALGFVIRGRSVSGEIEAHRGSTDDIVDEDNIKLHPDTKGDAQGEDHYGTGMPIGGCQAIDQPLARHPLSSKNCRSRGDKRGITAETFEAKKRQRCKKWSDDETEQLVNLRLESLRSEENVGRFGKNKSNEKVWEAISRHFAERTPEQCQNRWDTVVRSLKSTKQHSQVTMRDFPDMKVAPCRKSAEWYKMFDGLREAWDLSRRGKGHGSSDMKGASTADCVPSLPTTGSSNLDALHPEMVTGTSLTEQSGSILTAFETPTLQKMEMASSTRTRLVTLRRRDPQRKVTNPCGTIDQSDSSEGQEVKSSVQLSTQEAFARRSGIMESLGANSKTVWGGRSRELPLCADLNLGHL